MSNSEIFPRVETILTYRLTLAKPEPVPRYIDDERANAQTDEPEEDCSLQGKVRQNGTGYCLKSN